MEKNAQTPTSSITTAQTIENMSPVEWWSGTLTAWAAITGAAAAILTLLALVYSNKSGKLKDAALEASQKAFDIRIGELTLALEKQTEATLNARLELTKVHDVQQRQLPRNFTPEQRELLLILLKPQPKSHVTVRTSDADAEAVQFMHRVAKLLSEAGYAVTPRTDTILPMPFLGMRLRVLSKETAPMQAEHLQKAFKAVGYELEAELMEGMAPGDLEIFVGGKAPSE